MTAFCACVAWQIEENWYHDTMHNTVSPSFDFSLFTTHSSCSASCPPMILSWLDLSRAFFFLKSALWKSNQNKHNCDKNNLSIKCDGNYSITLSQKKKDADFVFDGCKIVTNILSDDHLMLHWDTDLRWTQAINSTDNKSTVCRSMHIICALAWWHHFVTDIQT